MHENVILVIIPKYVNSAQAPKNGSFQKISFFWKGFQISLLTSPQLLQLCKKTYYQKGWV